MVSRLTGMPTKIKSLALGALLGLAALIRFFNISEPDSLIFDEVYYVDGANDLLDHGVEVDGANPEFVVHPPLGKWLIGIGIALFGDSSFGWRFSTAVAGVISVLLLYLIALRLFRSESVALIAGSLLAIDGLAIVMSRTALLDNFLTLFILLAFYLLITRHFIGMGLALGAALAIKWSALYFLALFIAIAFALAYRASKRELISTIATAPLALLVYLISWSGWFLSSRGWDRDSNSNPVFALWNYHREIYDFHSNLDAKHPYRSDPLSWIVMGRPTSFFYESPEGCGADQCSQEILALGNPFIWWFGTIALFALFGYLISRRDRVSAMILATFAAGYLPWFLFPDRTMFTFYAITLLPFMILAISYLAHELLLNYRRAREVILACFVLVLLLFLYFLPIQTAQIITFDEWQSRMWLESWI